MAQASFAELEHDLKKRRTRRELFLEKMDKLVPWERLERRIEPFYAKAGRGRRPYPLSVMLRVHCVQLFYNLSDPGMEDLLYEVESVRRFVGLRLTEALPDETTILNFRHLLEKHGLGEGLFEEINAHLASRGHRLRTGTIVDASIIDAPSSTKNRRRARDPEMHRTKKGKQWYFGRLCCKLGEGAMRNQGASCSPYDSALARRSCSHAMASVRAHGPRPKARSTIRASPTMPPWRANIPAWPLRSARITSKPLIVA